MRELLNSFTKLEFDKIKNYIRRYALSDIGREHIENLVLSSSSDEIKLRLSLVTEMKTILESDEFPPLENILDIRISLQHSTIENFTLSSQELHSIALVLKTSKNILSYYSRRKDLYPLLFLLVKPIHQDKILEYNINRAIDEEGKVKDSASKELSTIRRQIVERSDFLKKRLAVILRNLVERELAQDEIITTRDGRMVIPIKVEHKNQMPGFIHSSSSSGATVYIEPTETLEVNNEIRTLQFQEQREIENILKDLTNQVRGIKEEILAMTRILGELDFIQAKAKYSIEIIGSEPVLKKEGKLKLVHARHPILLQRHKREEVVSLNMVIGDDIKSIIITGPNAGGKSVVLKTVGLLSLLLQAGCHIPASAESEMRIFTDIFVDMGDEQSIENDLSSFSSHLKNLKFIIENANENSLVLIDEIGSGTDPDEGASIAAAVLQRLSQIACATIATTHHGTLKTFAYETPYFQNAAMEFDLNTLKPTYNFRAGVPGSSYAIEMAERILMPENIIELSRSLKGNKANKLENLITDLERQSQELNKNLEGIKNEKIQLNDSIVLYKNKISSLEKEIKLIKAQAIDEAKLIVEKANATIEKIVKEIKESAAEKNIVKLAKTDIRLIDEEFNKLRFDLIEVDEPVVNFSVGDVVCLKKTGTIGEIASKVDIDNYIVIVGDVKIKTRRKELEAASKNIPYVKKIYQLTDPPSPKIKLDLRGMYGDEAIGAVDKFFDESILSGVYRVEIIHGKGTGSLRKKISEYLKTLSRVKSFRLGEWNEGGAGVTIVELV